MVHNRIFLKPQQADKLASSPHLLVRHIHSFTAPSSLMKRPIFRLSLLAAISLAFTVAAPAQSNDANPLGSFSFDFKRLGKTPSEQVSALKKIGFSGATLTFTDDFKAFSKEVKTGDFEIYAAHKAIRIGKKTKFNSQQISRAVDQVKSVNADFWLIILEKKGDKQSKILLSNKLNDIVNDEEGTFQRKNLLPILLWKWKLK